MELASRTIGLEESVTLAISQQVKKLKSEGKDIIDFTVGEPYYQPPKNVEDAIKKALKEGKTGYTAAQGTVELRDAVCRKYEQENMIYKPSQILISNGAKSAISNILLTLIEQGDEVLIPPPYWTSYPQMVKAVEGIPIIIEMDEKFKLNPKSIFEKKTDKTKLLILNSPNNPTGAILDYATLKEIARWAVKEDILVLYDEIYEKFIYDRKKHVSLASLEDEVSGIKERAITINGISKSYGKLTGLRIGWAAGNEEIIKTASNLQSQLSGCPPSLSQYAALEALTGPQGFVDKWKAELEARRDLVYDYLSKLDRTKIFFGFSDPDGANFSKPEGAFYFFIDIRRVTSDSGKFAEKLLEYGNVAVLPGSAFGREGFVRLGYSFSFEDIREGCERIDNAIGKIVMF